MATETQEMVGLTTTRLLQGHFPYAAVRGFRADQFPAGAWRDFEASGLPLALVKEEAGGYGLDAATAASIVRIAGSFAAPVPIAETMLANWILAGSGHALSAGPAAFAPVLPTEKFTLERTGDGWRLQGEAGGVAWGRHAASLAVVAEHRGAIQVAKLALGNWKASPGENMAGLPRDRLLIDAHLAAEDVRPAGGDLDFERVRAAGAAMRVMEIAGALERVTAMSAAYLNDRIQFGRPLAKQQVLQQQMAVLATQAAAAGASADIAAEAFDAPDGMLALASAKVRAGEAAGVGAAIAHQVHGAIGFTDEYPLQLYSRRLWSWRDEFGSESHWSSFIGRTAFAAGADELWAQITAPAARPVERG